MPLEYSPPARGTWTIAHVPLLIPGAHIIFVGASCCMRGVVLSAAECGAMDRFSMILVKEDDLFGGKMESMFIDGVAEILDALSALPPCAVLFSGCIHEAAGSDMEYVQKALEARYPEVDFIMSKMNPTMRKSGITPEELMRLEMYSPLGKHGAKQDPHTINIIGNIFPRSEESEAFDMLRAAGYTVADICTCKTYEDYLALANASVNIYMTPVAEKGAVHLSQRLGQKLFHFPVSFDMDETEETLRRFASELSLELPDTKALRHEAEAALEEAAMAARGMKAAIDFAAVSRPFQLAKLLKEHGFDAAAVYTDSVSCGDESAYQWCKANISALEVISPTCVASRFLHNKAGLKPPTSADAEVAVVAQGGKASDAAHGLGEKYLAIGQKAAYFCNTCHFVNIIENGSLWGFRGIRQMARLIERAAREESDMREIIQVKAWGCAEACGALRGGGKEP